MRYSLILLAIFPLIAISSPVYKWVDEAGIVHYTQTPPTRGNAVILSPQLPEVPPSQPDSPPQPPQNSAPKPDPRAEQEKLRQAEEERQNRCAIAQARLQELNNSRRVAVQDASGEYRRIDDDERAVLISQAEEIIRQDCQ